MTRLGWQASYRQKTSWGLIVPQLRVAWERENFDGDDATDVGLVNSPFLLVRGNSVRRVGGFSTTVSGHDREHNYLAAGAGVMLVLRNTWRIITDYEGHFFDSTYSEHFASLKVSYRF